MAVDSGDRPFVGRVEAVEALHRRFEDARAGSGGVTLLVGDTGVGKSRLVADLVRDIRARGIRVLEGRAPPVDAPPPFALIRSALEQARDDVPTDVPEATLFPGPAVADGILIGFAPRLDDATAAAPVRIEDRLLAALGEAEERREARGDPLWAGITEQFLAFTRRGPTVLVLEDLHRADDSSLAALEFLARQLQNRPLWILGTVRPFGVLPVSRRGRLESFESSTQARRIVLRPLTSGEVAEYLRGREPDRSFSPEEIARKYSESGGNPLLLEQLDRFSGAPGGPRRPAGGEHGAPELPPLDEDEERTLSVASVIGPELSFSLLLKASGDDEERLAETVDRLVARAILLERPGELLLFPDERFREAVYGRLTESRRRLLHRRAGEALEATGSADIATLYALARHFALGKVDEKSLQYNRAAAEIADRAYSPAVAREHLERALESLRRLRPDDWETETDLVLELARQVDHAGELQAAEELLRRHLGRRGLKARLPAPVVALLELYLARIQTDRGEWRAAEESTRPMLADPGLTAHPQVLLGVHHLRGEALYYQGRYPEALDEHTEELRLARTLGNERATALGQERRANVLAMLGRSDEALTEARAAALTLERLGDMREAAHAHLFIGVVLSGLRAPKPRWEESIAEFEASIRLAERARDQRRIGWALFNTADILRDAGELDQATEKNARSREILERIGDRFGLVQSMIIQGKISLDRGEYDRAEADLLDAYRLVRELKAPADEVDVVLRLAQLSFARGDRASARRRVAELERQNLPALRPDVVADFERLKNSLAPEDGDAPPP